MELYLFRLSLKATEAPGLFDARAEDGSSLSRESWLRMFFLREHQFFHYGSPFAFKPEDQLTSPPLLFGWIARERRTHERTPPAEGLLPTQHVAWQAAFFMLDPTEHPEGQLVAIEHNAEIGKPKALLGSLVRELNSQPGTPYFTQAFPIIDAGSFWAFSAKHKDQIVSISFDVAVPNMFNDADDFQAELRLLRDQVNVSNVMTRLDSDRLLTVKSPRMKSVIDYVERGAGDIEAKAADGAIYNSAHHERHVSVSVEHHTKNDRQFFREILNFIDRVFP